MGRKTSWKPASSRSAGRTNTSNETYADTGLPGSANSGVSSGPIVPKPCGIPGCMATRVNSTVPLRPSTSLTVSKAPMLTPPVVTTTSARTSWSARTSTMTSASSRTGPTR